MNGIRVAIVDDHSVIRQGMRSLLTEVGIEVVGEASNGHEAIQLAAAETPDVMLLDIRMRDCDGLTALPDIKAASPLTQVIMLTTYANPSYLAQAMENGASGYLLKEAELDEIVTAIQTAAMRGNLIDRNLLREALRNDPQAQTQATESNIPDQISEREYDVLKLLTEGLSNAEIADALSISITTVKTHVKHILQKLNVNDRTQAALTAIRQGMVD